MNADRGEVEVELGGARRRLQFLTAERQALETSLGKGLLPFLASGGGETVLLVSAITCGLARTEKKPPSPSTVQGWLDRYEGDTTELQKTILYAIARGMPKQNAAHMVKVLDEVFGRLEADAPGGTPSGVGAGPLEAAPPAG